jgi:hypothetical protein
MKFFLFINLKYLINFIINLIIYIKNSFNIIIKIIEYIYNSLLLNKSY